ncbi:hypothetical protein MPER_04256 [Moniliophthora perniciosa FA553]|nr:hypothetical protein MPER_04256 [Moniliophthora perniciosa FA553]
MFVIAYSTQTAHESVILFTAAKTREYGPFIEYSQHNVVKTVRIYVAATQSPEVSRFWAHFLIERIFNSVITLLTGIVLATSCPLQTLSNLFQDGRIWWIHRQVRNHGIHTSDTLLHSVTRIILYPGMTSELIAPIGDDVNSDAFIKFTIGVEP